MFSSGLLVTINDQEVATIYSPQKRDFIPIDSEQLTKKDTRFYKVDQCPQLPHLDYFNFGGSSCNEETGSTRAWVLKCNNADSTDSKQVTGYCFPGYDCITRSVDRGQGAVRIAWCIAQQELGSLRLTSSGDDIRKFVMTPQPQGQNPPNNVRIIVRRDDSSTEQDSSNADESRALLMRNEQLTEQDNGDALFNASLIEMAAKDKEDATLDQKISCHDCNGLSFLNWPTGTTHINANITLSDPNDEALLDIYGWHS